MRVTLKDFLASNNPEKVQSVLKSLRESIPKDPLEGIVPGLNDALSTSDLDGVTDSELNAAKSMYEKQKLAQSIDDTLAAPRPYSTSKPITMNDWQMADPALGRDIQKTLSRGLDDTDGLNKALNSPKATSTLVDRFHKIKQGDRLFENLQKSSMASEGSNFPKFEDAIVNAKEMGRLDNLIKEPLSKFEQFKETLKNLRSAPGQAISKAGDKFDDIISQLSNSTAVKKIAPYAPMIAGTAAAAEGVSAGGDFNDVINSDKSLQEKIGKSLQGAGKVGKGAGALMSVTGAGAMPGMLTALAGQALDTTGQVIESPSGYTPQQVKDINKGTAGFLADQNKLNPNAKTMDEFMKQPVSTAPEKHIDPAKMFDYVKQLPEDNNKLQQNLTNVSLPDVNEVKEYVKQAALERGIPAEIALGMIEQESAFNPTAVSRTGAKGIGQMFPAAYEDVVKNNPDKYAGLSYDQMTSPENWKKQTDAALDYYKVLSGYTKSNDPSKILRRYYGPSNPEQEKEADKHVMDVMERTKKYKEPSLASRGPASTGEFSSSIDPTTKTPETEAEALKRLSNLLNAEKGVTDLKGTGPLMGGPVVEQDRYAQLLASQDKLNQLKALHEQKKLNVPAPIAPSADKAQETTSDKGSDSQSEQVKALENLMQGFTNASVANRARAEELANENRLIAGLGKAGATIGAGIAGLGSKSIVKAATEGFDALEKTADQPIKTYEALTAEEKKDKDSVYSTSFREFLRPSMQELGMNTAILDNMSAEQMAAVFPALTRMFDAKETRDTKQSVLKEKAETKVNQDFNKLYATKADKINTLITGSRNGIGKAYSLRLLSERAKTLLDKYRGNFDEMPSKQFAELPRILDAMLSQGQATIAGMTALEQKTLMRKIAEAKDFLGNKPNPAKLGKFIENYDDLIDRELKTATSQVDKFVSSLYHDFPRQYRDNPEFDDQIKELISSKLSGDALQNPELDKKVREYLAENAQEIINQKAFGGAPSDNISSVYSEAQEAGIKAVSEKRGISREEAIKLLKENGKLK